MALDRRRYSDLAPLSIEARLTLALAAAEFFSPASYRANCEVLGKAPDERAVHPFGGRDFLNFLGKKQVLTEPDRHAHRIHELLGRMAAAGILTEVGYGRDVMMPKMYYFMKELTSRESAGPLWLARALGDDFLFRAVAHGIVRVLGKTREGDAAAGTGIVFDQHHVLTCAHVVNDIVVDTTQGFQAAERCVAGIFASSRADVAVIRVRETLEPVAGLSFVPPAIAQPVFVIGYPTIPYARDAVLTIQRGEVTSESVTTIRGQRVFLYSAIARPGNSGGPIVSADGHVVGITTGSFTQSGGTFSPHYAGVPTGEIVAALDELAIGVQVPIEDFA